MLCGGAEFSEFFKMMMVLLWLEWFKSKSYYWEILFSGVLPLFMPHLINCEVVSSCVSKTTDGLMKR